MSGKVIAKNKTVQFFLFHMTLLAIYDSWPPTRTTPISFSKMTHPILLTVQRT